MKKTIIALLALSTFAVSLRAQNVDFVDYPIDPRSAAMGATGAALEASAFSIYNNIAATSFTEDRLAASYSFSPWLRDYQTGNNLHTFGAFYRINEKHSVGIGFRYFNKHNYTQNSLDENGNPTGVFEIKPWDMTIDVGYAYRITSFLSVGANVRYVSSDFTPFHDRTSGVGFDIGTYFRKNFSVNNGLSAAVTLTNIGSKIEYGSSKTEMPARVKAAAAYDHIIANDHKLTFTGQLEYQFKPSDKDGADGGVGLEYCWRGMVSLRGGYRFAYDTWGPGYEFGTVGAGVHIGPAEVGFSMYLADKDSPVRNTMLFSVGVRF